MPRSSKNREIPGRQRRPRYNDKSSLKDHGIALMRDIFYDLSDSFGSTSKYDFEKSHDLPFNYFGYGSDSASFRIDYLLYNLYRKYSHFDLNIDRRAVALSSFLQSEERCKELNTNGYTLRAGSEISQFDCVTLMNRARRKIEYIIGTEPDEDAIRELCSYSGGASVKHRRTQSHQYYKFAETPHVTLNALELWRRWTKDTLYETLHPTVEIATNANGFFVPKSSKTDRFINIEPHGNMFLQKGIGSYIRRALRKVNINLNDQTINQQHAYTGSVDGSLATIDLSAASDSISLRLVRDLLPWDWYVLLLEARSEICKIDGECYELEKISSMGNGFTFELESMIFYALSSAVVELYGTTSTVSVYGDDIIVPSDCATKLRDLLYFVGFETNSSKSFWDGEFRESCGKHYYRGVDVTPFYVKESLSTNQQICLFANNLRKWAAGTGDICDPRAKRAYGKIRKSLPKFLQRPALPADGGDNALQGTFSECSPTWKSGCWHTAKVPLTRSKDNAYTDLRAFLLLKLTGGPDDSSIIRGKLKGGSEIGIIESSGFGGFPSSLIYTVMRKRKVYIWSDPPTWV